MVITSNQIRVDSLHFLSHALFINVLPVYAIGQVKKFFDCLEHGLHKKLRVNKKRCQLSAVLLHCQRSSLLLDAVNLLVISSVLNVM